MNFGENYSWLSIFLRTSVIGLVIVLISFRMRASKKKKPSTASKYTKDQIEARLKTFQPETLAPELTKTAKLYLDVTCHSLIKSKPGRHIKIGSKRDDEGVELLNFGTTDFLAFNDTQDIRDAAIASLDSYGVGSCGPRTFYGTHDVHLLLEKELMDFFNVDDCIVYSDSFSTISSVLGVFAKKGDFTVIDEKCNEAILNGAHLSRSNVRFFKHNDPTALEVLLKEIREKSEERILIVTEAIFKYDGSLPPLKEIVALKKQYDAHLCLDESHSFGVLGATGKGLTEKLGLKIAEDIDFYLGSLDTFCCSIGGFCVASKEVVLHQRLFGAGYIFSAAVPPFLSFAATCAMELLIKDPSACERLRNLAAKFNELWFNSKAAQTGRSLLLSSDESALKNIFIRDEKLFLGNDNLTEAEKDFRRVELLQKIKSKLEQDYKIFAVVPHNPPSVDLPYLAPCIKLVLTLHHELEDIEFAVKSLSQCFLDFMP